MISPSEPLSDLKITSGHYVHINGEKIKARNVKGRKRINVKPQCVYSIISDQYAPFWANGLGVYTWTKDKWLLNAKEKGIMWHENKL